MTLRERVVASVFILGFIVTAVGAGLLWGWEAGVFAAGLGLSGIGWLLGLE